MEGLRKVMREARTATDSYKATSGDNVARLLVCEQPY